MKLVIRIEAHADGGYRAWCPALPGCSVQAGTKQDAQCDIQEAVTGYLASMDVALPRQLHVLEVDGGRMVLA